MQRPHKTLDTNANDFWLARGAVLVIVGLQLGIVNDLTVGPRWLAPSLELALLLPLSVATAWTQKAARKASSDPQWLVVGRDRRRVRMLAITLTGLSTLMNFGALAQLIAAILGGHAGTGRTLLLDALNIWLTNVVVFALWFWTVDRSGPAVLGLNTENKSDFLFSPADDHWQPTICRLDTRLYRLPILGLHKCDGILARRHFPTDGQGQGSHDGRIRYLTHNHRSRRISRGWDIELKRGQNQNRGTFALPSDRIL